MSVQTQYTCLACRVGFATGEDQRVHYKTDWHRYNLRRKVAGLPPIAAEAFRSRVFAQQKLNATPESESFTCEVCNKHFSSLGAYNNHMQSKKHRQRVKAGVRRCTTSRSKPDGEQPAPAAPMDETADSSSPSDRTPVLEAAAAAAGPAEGPADASGAAAASEGPEEDGSSVEEEKPAMAETQCLFCPTVADSFDGLVDHMTKTHNFFIPDRKYLTNPQGLIFYLQLKVGNYFECIKCNGSGKAFHSLEAVQKHMRDKGHLQVDYSDEGALELSEFYDFSTSYPDWQQVPEDELDDELSEAERAHLAEATYDEMAMELVLPSGGRAVHRSLNKYHKQRFAVEDDRDSVVIQRLMSKYKAIGLGSVEPMLAARRRERASHLRVQKKLHVGVGVKANKLQKFFRDQVMQ